MMKFLPMHSCCWCLYGDGDDDDDDHIDYSCCDCCRDGC